MGWVLLGFVIGFVVVKAFKALLWAAGYVGGLLGGLFARR